MLAFSSLSTAFAEFPTFLLMAALSCSDDRENVRFMTLRHVNHAHRAVPSVRDAPMPGVP